MLQFLRIAITPALRKDPIAFFRVGANAPWRQVLSKNFLFSSLDEQQANIILDAVEEVIIPKGQRIINQGDEGSFMCAREAAETNATKNPPQKQNHVAFVFSYSFVSSYDI